MSTAVGADLEVGPGTFLSKKNEIREKALKDLQQFQVLMLDGHFDFGNGYHGRLYLNPHQLFRYPSTIWRFAQDLIDVLPASVLDQTEVVAGPATGGALLAHTLAGLLDSRRAITGSPTMFAPFMVDAYRGPGMSRFYRQQIVGRNVLIVDDVRNTGQTLARCAHIVRSAGGRVIATAELYDRMEAGSTRGVTRARVIRLGRTPQPDVVRPAIRVVPARITIRHLWKHRCIPGEPFLGKALVHIAVPVFQVRTFHRIVGDVEQERVLANLQVLQVTVAHRTLRVCLVAPEEPPRHRRPVGSEHRKQVHAVGRIRGIRR